MMAIGVIGALFLYGWLSCGVVWLVMRWAKKRGRHPIRWGIVAGLIMYHLVFWDFLPTLIVYKYYCATKAGFWVYKTPEQWKSENPGVAETLTWRERSQHYEAPGIIDGYQLNERIISIRKESKTSCVPIWVSEYLIIDKNYNKILVKRISIRAGYVGGEFTRFWTYWETYMPNNKEFGKYETAFKELGRAIK